MSEQVLEDAPVVIGIQSMLYHTPLASVERMLRALENASMIGLREHRCRGFVVTLGDGSSEPVLAEDDLERFREMCPHIHNIRYHWFGWNAGTARGHNVLAEMLPEPTHLVFANPDVVVEPRAIWRMLEVFDDDQVGMVEAKQLPIEHPKDYEQGTGLTSWATTAFAMTPRTLFEELDGFDADSFFMYCDDVDYSWRVRELGKKVVMHAGAVVFHDKYLDPDAKWLPTKAEVRYSAEAALMMAHKWSRPRLLKRILKNYESSDVPEQKQAAAGFRRREREGTLPEPRDADHRIGTFHNWQYAKHRFAL